MKNGTNLLLSRKNCKQYCTITLPIFPGHRRNSINSETSFCSMSILWPKFRSIVNWNKQTTEYLKIFLWLYMPPVCSIQLMTSWTVAFKRLVEPYAQVHRIIAISHHGSRSNSLSLKKNIFIGIKVKAIYMAVKTPRVAPVAVRTALVWWRAASSERYIRPVAQLFEHRVVVREVVSSTPAGPTLRVLK